jgi:PAS domain S-box-containing protein
MQQVLSEGAARFACSDGISLAPVELLVSRLLSSGEAQYSVLEDFTRPDGAKRWLQLDAVPVYGEHRAIVVTFQDVTERVQTELVAFL